MGISVELLGSNGEVHGVQRWLGGESNLRQGPERSWASS
jgi:hypothetical protein